MSIIFINNELSFLNRLENNIQIYFDKKKNTTSLLFYGKSHYWNSGDINYLKENEKRILRNNKNIVFIYWLAFEDKVTDNLERCIKPVFEDLNIEKYRCMYITGDLGAENYFKNLNFNVLSYNYILRNTQEKIINKPFSEFPYVKNNNYKTIRNKHFICLNYRDRNHRRYLTGMLYLKGLNKNGYISNLLRGKDKNQLKSAIDNFCYNETDSKYLRNFWEQNCNPIFLDVHSNCMKNDRWVDLNYVLDSYINVVTETNIQEYHSNFLFITEKTHKAFLWKQIPLIVGNKGTLKKLKEMGFYTFPEIINEDYDEIDSMRERINFVLNELERICLIDIKEMHEMYLSVKSKIEYNFNHMFNYSTNKDLENLFERIKKYHGSKH